MAKAKSSGRKRKPAPKAKPKPKRKPPKQQPQPTAKPSGDWKLQQQLARALETARDVAGFPCDLQIVSAPTIISTSKWRPLWLVIGEFSWHGEFGYDELHAVLVKWSQRRVTDKVNKHRIARLRVNYLTDRGKREEYTLAETGPWNLALARAQQECDPDDTEGHRRNGVIGSLASRYGLIRDKRGKVIAGTQIESVTVWLASNKIEDLKF